VPNYTGLNELVSKFGANGLVVLGFPCGQFANQEPGKNNEILNGVKYVRPGGGFVPAFPVFGKLAVNVSTQDPLFAWIQIVCPQPSPLLSSSPADISWSPVTTASYTWNFEKVLFDRKGKPVRRYDPSVAPSAMEKDIQALLAM